MSRSESSARGSGLPLPSTQHTAQAASLRWAAAVCNQWDSGLFGWAFSYVVSWFHSGFLRLFRDPRISRNVVKRGLIWSIVLTEIFASVAPLSCHCLTTHTGIPKPPILKLSLTHRVLHIPHFSSSFFWLPRSPSFFPIRLLVKKQLQSLYSLSLKLN